MAYATTAFTGSAMRVPPVAVPKVRWPRFSPRMRALMMMGVMISPAFLADQIGYGVERLFMTADQIDARQVPDNTMLSQVNIFHVACVDADAPAAEHARWADYAAQRGWPRYPEGGPTCFNPDQNLYGIAGLTAFNVVCPRMLLTVADHRRWVAFAANHGWTDYAQAGDGCVDP